MRERPIIFSGPMVRAILDGRKTQTRRLMRPQPHPGFLARGVSAVVPQWPHQDGVRWFMNDGLSELVKCPYGQPGDRLWVRETFRVWTNEPDPDILRGRLPDVPDDYRASFASRVQYRAGQEDDDEAGPWRPAIYMPRWASRITLEIAGVRVERVQDISAEDAIAEGVDPRPHRCGCEVCGTSATLCTATASSILMEFRELWDTINGKRAPWSSNPWVWVVSFKKV